MILIVSCNVASTDYTGLQDTNTSRYSGMYGEVLHVPYSYQGDTSWCLYYCLAMMADYNDRSMEAWEMASSFNSGNNETFSGQYNPFDHAIEDYLKEHADLEIKKTVWGYNLRPVDTDSFNSMIRMNIDKGQPVLLAFQYTIPGYAKKGHAILAVGYSEEFIYLTDPSGAITRDLFGSDEGYIAVPISWQEFNEKLAGNIMPSNMAFTIEVLEDAPASVPGGSVYLTDYSSHGLSCLNFINRTNDEDIGLLYLDGKYGRGYYIAQKADPIKERRPTANDAMSVFFTVANPSMEGKDYIVVSDVIDRDTGKSVDNFCFPLEIMVPPFSMISKGVNYSNQLGTVQPGAYSIVITLLDSEMQEIDSTSIDVSIC